MLRSQPSRYRIGKMADLREDRIGVDEGPRWNLHEPRTQGVHAGEIQEEICGRTNAADPVGAWPEPARRVGIMVCPAVA
jgi:hypothetical protein